jgi:hypothetical protein
MMMMDIDAMILAAIGRASLSRADRRIEADAAKRGSARTDTAKRGFARKDAAKRGSAGICVR